MFVFMAYWNTFLQFNVKSVMFFVSAIFLIFNTLLFVGGFIKKSSLTVTSSLILILVTGYHSFLNLESGFNYNFAVYVVLGSVYVYFLAVGNKR